MVWGLPPNAVTGAIALAANRNAILDSLRETAPGRLGGANPGAMVYGTSVADRPIAILAPPTGLTVAMLSFASGVPRWVEAPAGGDVTTAAMTAAIAAHAGMPNVHHAPPSVSEFVRDRGAYDQLSDAEKRAVNRGDMVAQTHGGVQNQLWLCWSAALARTPRGPGDVNSGWRPVSGTVHNVGATAVRLEHGDIARAGGRAFYVIVEGSYTAAQITAPGSTAVLEIGANSTRLNVDPGTGNVGQVAQVVANPNPLLPNVWGLGPRPLRVYYRAQNPPNTLGNDDDLALVFRSGAEPEIWERTGGAWIKLATWPAPEDPTLSSILTILLTAPGVGANKVLALDAAGENPQWRDEVGGVTAAQFAAHTSNASAHHTVPDVAALILAHAGDADAHHAPPTIPDVAGLIAAHAGDADAHHAPPTGLPAATAADEGRIAKVNAAGDWVLGTDLTASPGSGTTIPIAVPRFAGGGVHLVRIAQKTSNSARSFDILGTLDAADGGWDITANNPVNVKSILDGDNNWYWAKRNHGHTVDYDNLTDKPITRISSDAALPTPSASELGRRYQTNKGHQWTGREEVEAGTDRVLNFSLFPVDTTSTSGFRFQGSVDHFSDIPQNPTIPDEGKWWMVRSGILQGSAPFILVDANANHQSIAHSPESSHPYIGAWDARGSAEGSHEFTAAGQLAIFPDSSDDFQVYQVNADFVAGTPDIHRYHFSRSDVTDLLLARIDNLEAAVAALQAQP